MAKFSMRLDLRKVKNDPDVFEFTISTPTLRSQFRLPREVLNKLRVLIEKALTARDK